MSEPTCVDCRFYAALPEDESETKQMLEASTDYHGSEYGICSILSSAWERMLTPADKKACASVMLKESSHVGT